MTPQHRPEAENVSTCRAEIARMIRRVDMESAMRIAVDGAALHPNDHDIIFCAATLLEMRGRPCEAAPKLKDIIAANATHVSALSSLARLTAFKTELNVTKAVRRQKKARISCGRLTHVQRLLSKDFSRTTLQLHKMQPSRKAPPHLSPRARILCARRMLGSDSNFVD